MKNYYHILGIQPTATKEEIKKAYKLAALKWHPDRNSHPDAHARIVEINEAYETLMDDSKRFIYDQRRSYQQQVPPQQPYQQQYQRRYEPYTPPRARQYRHTERKSGSFSGWNIVHACWILFVLIRVISIFSNSSSNEKFDMAQFHESRETKYTFNPDSIAKAIKIPAQIINADKKPLRPYLVFSKNSDGIFFDNNTSRLYNMAPGSKAMSLNHINTIVIHDYSEGQETDSFTTYYLDADSLYLFKKQNFTDAGHMVQKTFIELVFGDTSRFRNKKTGPVNTGPVTNE